MALFRYFLGGLLAGIGIGGAWAPIVAGFSLGWYTLIPLGFSLAGLALAWLNYREAKAVARAAGWGRTEPPPAP